MTIQTDGPAADAPIVVGISTIADRARTLALPEPEDGIRYVIVVQAGSEEPLGIEKRPDCSVHALQGTGVSANRNAVIRHAQEAFPEAILIFSDDDVVLETAGLRALGQRLSARPDLDMAAGWRGEHGGKRRAKLDGRAMSRFNCGRIAPPELAIRLSAIPRAGLSFDEGFGVGSAVGVGEEFVFVCDALRAGLRGAHFDIVTGHHPHDSTGADWRDAEILRSRAAVLRRAFGPVLGRFMKAPLALRHRRRFANLAALGWFVLAA